MAAMQRARDQEACGCDEVHGTQISYDDSEGEVIVLDDDDEIVDRRPVAPSARPTQKMVNTADEKSKGKLENEHGHTLKERFKEKGSGAGAGPSHSLLSAKTKQSKYHSDVIDLTDADSKEGSPELLEDKLATEMSCPWTCKACTFINESSDSKCEICATTNT